MSKILIADDSAIVIKVQSTILRAEGFEVVVARDGIEAVQAVYRERPDLVLLDIFMPRMNGYQVCRLLQHDPVVAGIPIVINTASDTREAEFWSLHTGADAFLFKGASPVELLAIVERLLREKSANPAQATFPTPDAEEILSRVSSLADRELYNATVQHVHLQTILENLCEGILLLDNQGRVANANRFLCRLVGDEESDLIGRTLGEALGEPTGATVEEMFRAAMDGGEVAPRDGALCDKAGRVTPVSMNVAPVRDHLDDIVGCVVLLQDITRRKQVEALGQLKNDLTTMIVHDLRTPLTSLLTGLQSFPDREDISLSQQELLDISIDGGKTLLGMINDLLDISKMEDGSMLLERRLLQPELLASNALKQVVHLAADKQLKLSCDIGESVGPFWGDEDKLGRTLVNLLSNAVKFTPQGGCVSLSIRPAPGAEAAITSLLFQVQDSGEGIPSSAFERIFEKFGQSETRKAGRKMSTGLGLTFCKMVVEAHGGRIWVQSAPGEGSTFSFVLSHRPSAANMDESASRDRRIRPIVPWPHPEPRIGARDRREPQWERPDWF